MAQRNPTALTEFARKHHIFIADDVGFDFTGVAGHPVAGDEERMEELKRLCEDRGHRWPLPERICGGGEEEGGEFESRLVARADMSGSGDPSTPRVLVRVPRQAVLCEGTVGKYAQADEALGRVLEEGLCNVRHPFRTARAAIAAGSRLTATET
jgi:hypothetical protein